MIGRQLADTTITITAAPTASYDNELRVMMDPSKDLIGAGLHVASRIENRLPRADGGAVYSANSDAHGVGRFAANAERDIYGRVAPGERAW